MTQAVDRWLRGRYKPRICDYCGRTYGRRTMVEAWDLQPQPGAKITPKSWHKTILKICTRCGGARLAQRALIAVTPRPQEVQKKGVA